MTKRILLLLICICCLFIVFGCGDSEPAPGDENTISIEVANNTSGIFISYALFYGNNLDEWGENLLGEEVIEPGEVFTFVLPVGNYTFIPLTYEYYILPGARDINQDIRIDIGGNGLVPVLIRNHTESDIAFLFLLDDINEDLEKELEEDLEESIEEDLEENFEEDLNEGTDLEIDLDESILGTEVIPAGLSRFIFLEPGTYNFLGLGYEGEVLLVGNEIAIEGETTVTVE
jgi:hypothetical protein